MKNIKRFDTFINEAMRVMPKGLNPGFKHVMDIVPKPTGMKDDALICVLGTNQGQIVFEGFKPGNAQGPFRVYQSFGSKVQDKSTDKTFNTLEEAVNYANQLVGKFTK